MILRFIAGEDLNYKLEAEMIYKNIVTTIILLYNIIVLFAPIREKGQKRQERAVSCSVSNEI